MTLWQPALLDGAARPSALPHDRRVRNADPGNPTRSRWLETALFTAVAVNAFIS